MDGNRRIDILVAEMVTKVEPRRTLEVSNDGGKSSAFGNDDWSTRYVDIHAWLAEKKAKGMMTDYEVVEWKHYPRYSSLISSAWEVVRHLKAKGERLHFDDFNNRYCASFSNGVHNWKRNYEHASEAMAICGAALKAVGMTHDEIESALEAQ